MIFHSYVKLPEGIFFQKAITNRKQKLFILQTFFETTAKKCFVVRPQQPLMEPHHLPNSANTSPTSLNVCNLLTDFSEKGLSNLLWMHLTSGRAPSYGIIKRVFPCLSDGIRMETIKSCASDQCPKQEKIRTKIALSVSRMLGTPNKQC